MDRAGPGELSAGFTNLRLKAAKRAGTLGDAPQMNKQLGKGNISCEHVDALTSAASGLDDEKRAALLELDGELALAAASKTREQFLRHVNKQSGRSPTTTESNGPNASATRDDSCSA